MRFYERVTQWAICYACHLGVTKNMPQNCPLFANNIVPEMKKNAVFVTLWKIQGQNYLNELEEDGME